MSKTKEAAKREAGKKSAKKINHHVEADKPLMTLEKAREVLKTGLRCETGDGAAMYMRTAKHLVENRIDEIDATFNDDRTYSSDIDRLEELRILAGALVEEVELMIAATVNLEALTSH